MSDITLGPIDYFIVEFAQGQVVVDGFRALLDLVERGIVYVVDIEFLSKAQDGTVTTLAAHDLGSVGGLDFAEFDGAVTGLLDDEDVAVVRAAIAPGTTAAVVVYEELSIAGVLDRFAAGGARLVAQGPVDVSDLEAALD